MGGPHLVVCPLSVLSSWMKEFKHWCPELRVIRLHSSDKAERERFRRYDCCLPLNRSVMIVAELV